MMARIRKIRSSSNGRRELLFRWAEMYGQDIRTGRAPILRNTTRLNFNYSKNYLDTWVSQICKSRVIPMVMTTGGTYEAREKAAGLNLFWEAMFDRLDVYDQDPVITRDAGLFGLAVMYVAEELGQPICERVLLTEIDIDDYEWRAGKGRTFYRTRAVDRCVAAEMYPDAEKEIFAAPAASIDERNVGNANDCEHDLIDIRYGWHLPSGPDADDGKFCVAIEGATLEFEDYEYEDLPFAWFPRTRPVVGLFGDSLIQEMSSGQEELDQMSARIQEAIKLLGVPRILVKEGDINTNHLNDQVGGIIHVKDPMSIKEWNAEPISPQVTQYYEMIIAKMAAVSTVSPMAARGEKPAGITAASALQLMDDQESERKIVPQRNRERFYVQLAKLIKRVCENIPGFQVNAKDGNQAVTVKLDEVKLDDDDLIYTVTPTSFIAKTPAARMQQAHDLMNLGRLEPENVFKFLDIPDMASETALLTARKDFICKTLESIIRTGEYVGPDPFMDLNMAKKLVGDYLAKSGIDGVDEDRLELLRNFGKTVYRMLNLPVPGEMPAPAAPPGMPPGGPPAPGMPQGGPLPMGQSLAGAPPAQQQPGAPPPQ